MEKISESQIEEYLRKKVEALGGKCYKWVSPGNVGVPDRIVMLSGGKIYFVELKSAIGTLTPWQKKQKDTLSKLGQLVVCLRSKQDVDAFIRIIQKREVVQ